MQPKTINGFELKKLLGTGGMAEVWYAESEIGMKAAVKILIEKLSHDDQMQERFLNEAKVMVQLDHPNIRRVYGYGDIDGRPAIVMEYLDGSDLKTRMKNGEHFSDEELQRWWNQMVDALNYTHTQNIVHRDIKPSNIFVDSKGNAKLLDFGIAKVADTTTGTLTGSTLGTRIYMSPEQVRDPKRVGTASDAYSLAVTFVHLLTGKAPYDSTISSDYEIQVSIVTQPVDLSKVPAEWQRFLEPYLNKEADKRPALRHFEIMPIEGKEEKKLDDDETVSDTGRGTAGHETPAGGTPTDTPSTKGPQRGDNPLSPTPNDNPKSRKALWIGLAIAAVVALLVLLLRPKPEPTPIDSDTQAYEACETVDDYRAYIHDFGPNALHYADAKAYVDRYVADSSATADSLDHVKQEAMALAQAQQQAEAQAEEEKKEDAAYQKCTTIKDCESYLEAYPQGRYVAEVQAKKAEFEAQTLAEAEKKEDDAYNKCTTIEGCNAYLKTYPKGRYVIEVRNKKAALEKEAKTEAEAKAKEEAEKEEADAYKKCTTIAACDSYLKTYPQGTYADEVRKKRDELSKAEAAKPLVSVTGQYKGHDYVDLGLPSGTLWATCNVGANKPDGYGNYYAWGEVMPKELYEWNNYKYACGDHKKLTKYCNKSEYGQNDFTDNLIVLQPADDAASSSWGNGWRLPTIAQWKELMQNTTSDAITQNGVRGKLFVGPNGNSLFLPAAGYYDSGKQCSVSFGYYWSNSICSDYPYRAWGFWFNLYPKGFGVDHESRKYGKLVRAVRSSH